jgi:hypothetical protein
VVRIARDAVWRAITMMTTVGGVSCAEHDGNHGIVGRFLQCARIPWTRFGFGDSSQQVAFMSLSLRSIAASWA